MATGSSLSGLTASIFDSLSLNSTATSGAKLYSRDVSVPLNSTREDAASLGTLTTDQTQLDIKGQVSRENSTHFYKFHLDGDNLKLNFMNNTGSSGLRLQVLNSNGIVVADSSSRGFTSLRNAYADALTTDGLDLEAGDYYVKVTFDVTSLRGTPQTYSVGLYSGTRFSESYQTTGKSQTSTKQAVLLDNTMTYALIDAQAYENKTVHRANEKPAEAINIGWLFQNKAALEVSSWLTDVCSTQYYTFTLQRGEDLKLAFNNKTNTSEIRFQLLDSLGSKVLADTHGTEAQKEAFEQLTSADGWKARPGQYVIKVKYADGERETKQTYDFKLYSGTVYNAMYKTIAGTETAQVALAGGRLVPGFTMQSAAVSYLQSMANGEDVNIMETISQMV